MHDFRQLVLSPQRSHRTANWRLTCFPYSNSKAENPERSLGISRSANKVAIKYLSQSHGLSMHNFFKQDLRVLCSLTQRPFPMG